MQQMSLLNYFEKFASIEKHIYSHYLCVRVYVCVCMRACVCVCARAFMHVKCTIQPIKCKTLKTNVKIRAKLQFNTTHNSQRDMYVHSMI